MHTDAHKAFADFLIVVGNDLLKDGQTDLGYDMKEASARIKDLCKALEQQQEKLNALYNL